MNPTISHQISNKYSQKKSFFPKIFTIFTLMPNKSDRQTISPTVFAHKKDSNHSWTTTSPIQKKNLYRSVTGTRKFFLPLLWSSSSPIQKKTLYLLLTGNRNLLSIVSHTHLHQSFWTFYICHSQPGFSCAYLMGPRHYIGFCNDFFSEATLKKI